MKKNLIILFLFSAQTLFGAEVFTSNTSNTIVATKDSNNNVISNFICHKLALLSTRIYTAH